MTPLHRRRSANVLLRYSWLGVFVLCSVAPAQLVNLDQQIEVKDLPSLISPSPHSSDILVTSLAIVLHNPEVCCGKDSALEDSVEKADPKSLQDVAAKLTGRHLLGDGRPIMVNAEFFPPEKTTAGYLITTMTSRNALLMEWNSRVYVVHGLIYFWQPAGTPDGPAGPIPVVHKFLLWDTRYSDSRRELVFNRDSDDLGKVQGFLFIEAKPQ
jgi:hypothetical protein